MGADEETVERDHRVLLEVRADEVREGDEVRCPTGRYGGSPEGEWRRAQTYDETGTPFYETHIALEGPLGSLAVYADSLVIVRRASSVVEPAREFGEAAALRSTLAHVERLARTFAHPETILAAIANGSPAPVSLSSDGEGGRGPGGCKAAILGSPWGLRRCDLQSGHDGEHEHDDGDRIVRWSGFLAGDGEGDGGREAAQMPPERYLLVESGDRCGECHPNEKRLHFRCIRCNGGGLVPPGDWCDECGGSGTWCWMPTAEAEHLPVPARVGEGGDAGRAVDLIAEALYDYGGALAPAVEFDALTDEQKTPWRTEAAGLLHTIGMHAVADAMEAPAPASGVGGEREALRELRDEVAERLAEAEAEYARNKDQGRLYAEGSWKGALVAYRAVTAALTRLEDGTDAE